MSLNLYSNISLYGGALKISLPSNFIDISKYRHVPDNQEVYSNAETDRSICIEIVEPLNNNNKNEENDVTLGKEYFIALAKDSAAINNQINKYDIIKNEQMPLLEYFIFNIVYLDYRPNIFKSFCEGYMLVSKGREDDAAANKLHVFN